MTSWLEAIPALLAALLIMATPGAVVVAALRVSPWLAVGLAPAVSVSIIAVSAIVGPVLGLRWGWGVAALGTAVVVVVVLLLRRLVPALRVQGGGKGALGGWCRPSLGAVAGVLLGFVITFAVVANVARNPEQITEGYDTVFHLNAVQYVLEQGNASSLGISSFILPDSRTAFYPAAWHAIVALLVQLTGVSIPAGTNIVWLATAGVVWPASCVFFVRVLTGRQTAGLVAAGGLAAVFPAFPYLLLYYGSAYPNSLANSLVPVGLGLVVLLIRQFRTARGSRSLTLVLLVLFLPGAALAQPNSIFSISLVLTPLLVVVAYRWIKGGFDLSSRQGLFRVGKLFGSAAAAAAILFSIPQFRSLFHWTSPKSMSVRQAIWSNLTQAPDPMQAPAWALTVLMLLGLIIMVLRYRQPWMVASLVLTVLVYALAAGTNNTIANSLLAPWWDNPERIAALLPLLAVPLAAVAVGWLCTQFLRLAAGIGNRAPQVFMLLCRYVTPAVAAVAVVVLAFFNPTLDQMEGALARTYRVPAEPDPQAQLDTDELALIGELGNYTTEDDVLANNPYNGSALAMALAHRKMLFPYSSMTAYDKDLMLLSQGLNMVGFDQEVCAAAVRKGVTYLLDFGMDFIAAQESATVTFPGIDLASDSGAFSLVAQVGHAKLYKLSTCAGGPSPAPSGR